MSTRYSPLPTNEKIFDSSSLIHSINHHQISNDSNLPLISSSPSDSSSLSDSSFSSTSSYPPSPSSLNWNWSRSFFLRVYHRLSILSITLLEICPIDKFLSQFRLRKILISLALISISTLSIFLLSFIFQSQLLPIPDWLTLAQRPSLDQEESYRWNPTNLSSSDNILPFLLNRFGYSSSSNFSLFNSSSRIPNILHVVPPGKGIFSYLQFLSISSAVKHIKPIRTIAHVIRGTLPDKGTNFWWDEVMRLDGFEFKEVDDPKQVFGNPVLDISHKSDIIRLQALQEYGGVYIDTDVIVLRSFEELMTGREEIVLGVEKADGTFENPVKVNGLCNAVIISKKNSKFLKNWWESYRTFHGQPFKSGGLWNFHSVILPWELAKNADQTQTPVTVLDHRSFFTPLWDDPGLKWVHGTLLQSSPPPSSRLQTKQKKIKTHEKNLIDSNNQPQNLPPPPTSRFRLTLADLDRPLSSEFGQDDLVDIERLQHGELAPDLPGFGLESTGQFAYHMWHHLLDERISLATDGLLKSASDLSVEDTLNRDSSFNRVAKKYLTSEILKRYWKFKKQNVIAAT
ncbi:hypothetical protein O181_070145 [Austropuccinia psidii MF-1]|uniref:Glycosyltransferase family 32 protein n=1 Tax=Austropuccinia psidii MF-1 TaxID=1389203 RepID=A0A9Q3EVV8_9BASI|nr:hypothetical protein [Austropuccinia psidii MF-1]